MVNKQNMHLEQSSKHHLKGLQPVLRLMHAKGISAERCLMDTGLDLADILSDQSELSLAQEFTIYRNILCASEEECLGLALGQAFELQSYGVLGYAILSAATVAEALSLVADFSELTYSHFKISLEKVGNLAGLVFSPRTPLPKDLLPLYADRDISAAVTAFNSFSLQNHQAQKILMMHSEKNHESTYREFYNCDIEFNADYNALLFEPELLEQLLPQRDPQAASYLRKQCEQLHRSFNQNSELANKIRELMLSEPGIFPDIKTLSEKLHISERSLRRKLKEEGFSFQQLLNDVRRELAKQYLQAGLSIEQIAELLDYSETANFSHAFKRWTGMSPVQYRKEKVLS